MIGVECPDSPSKFSGTNITLTPLTFAQIHVALQFTSPVALSNDGPVSVGQSNFNPRDHPHVNAAVVVAKTLDICNAQVGQPPRLDTCGRRLSCGGFVSRRPGQHFPGHPEPPCFVRRVRARNVAQYSYE